MSGPFEGVGPIDSRVPPRLDLRGFRRELTPVWLATATLLAGERPLDPATAMKVAHIGCRSGVTPAVVAAVHPDATVWAWDPRPAAVEETRRLRDHARLSNLTVHERSDLPPVLGGDLVDVVIVEGILDSVRDDVRRRVVSAIESSVRPGGLVVMTYRTVVGWIEIAPVQRLMRYSFSGDPRDGAVVADELVALLGELRAGGARYFTERPIVSAWLDELTKTDPAIVLAEYLERDLEPISHAQVVEALAPLGLRYVTSACLTGELDSELPSELAELIAEARTPVLRETLRDLATRRAHRADIFRLGTAPMPPEEQEAAVHAIEFVNLQTGARSTFTTEDVEWLRSRMASGEIHPLVQTDLLPDAVAAAAALNAVLQDGTAAAPLIGSALERATVSREVLSQLGVR